MGRFIARYRRGDLALSGGRILFVTSEIDDFVRVGGLAAVSAALPRALRAMHDIRIILPGYPAVLRRAQLLEKVGQCPPVGQLPACEIARLATEDGLPVYAVICPALYERLGSPYGDGQADWPDNDMRFARLAAAAADLAQGAVDVSWAADVIHANDWQSALTPAYLAWRGAKTPTILTIHNLAYQGLFAPETLVRIGAPDNAFHIEGIEFYNRVSFLKAGIVYASHVTTVSETYAREITTPTHGCGLDGLLRRRAQEQRLSGILNGIDESWDPRTCGKLSSTFEPGDWKRRQANADHVRRSFNLAVTRGPLFGLVARLVHQKGVDLVLSAMETIISSGGQVVVSGAGEASFERELQECSRRFPHSVGVTFQFDESQARNIFAASDFTLMPSRFEPCGLSQMYAQRFGSLPIGHQTGGLAETIADGETGFLFPEPTTASFLGAVCRAFAAYGRRPMLNRMRRKAMAKSFSWKTASKRYADLYDQVLGGNAA
jgi:starch synthase